MIRLTLILDGEESEQLVGLLSKALGRGEMGVRSMQIEATGEPKTSLAPAAGDEELERLIKRLPGAKKARPMPKQGNAPPPKHKRPRVISALKAAEIIVAHIEQRGPVSFSQLADELVRHGFAKTSANTAMVRARRYGVERNEAGLYVIRSEPADHPSEAVDEQR